MQPAPRESTSVHIISSVQIIQSDEINISKRFLFDPRVDDGCATGSQVLRFECAGLSFRVQVSSTPWLGEREIERQRGREEGLLEPASPQYTTLVELVALQSLAKPYLTNKQISIDATTATGDDARGRAQSSTFSIARARGVSEVY